MQTPVIIDLIAAAVLIGFTYFGAAKGLVRALAGLAAAVVSLAGANLIATALTGQAMKLAAPVIEQQIEIRLDEAIHDAFPGQMPGNPLDELDLPVEELLDLLGLDAQVRDSLTGRAMDTVRDAGVSAASAVVESLAYSVLHGILYFLSFLALRVGFQFLIRALKLLTKLPGLHGLNAWGGGLLGMAEGALLLFAAAWVMQQMGISLTAGEHGRILAFFAANSPLRAFSEFIRFLPLKKP
ncbi:MAG: CvpA family protein [Oscillibacter sp.]|nr:CvpA family protein [Oscillibacter sp.]